MTSHPRRHQCSWSSWWKFQTSYFVFLFTDKRTGFLFCLSIVFHESPLDFFLVFGSIFVISCYLQPPIASALFLLSLADSAFSAKHLGIPLRIAVFSQFETESVSVLRWGVQTPTLLGPLERANLNHWTGILIPLCLLWKERKRRQIKVASLRFCNALAEHFFFFWDGIMSQYDHSFQTPMRMYVSMSKQFHMTLKLEFILHVAVLDYI
jgi:hypothetical protein